MEHNRALSHICFMFHTLRCQAPIFGAFLDRPKSGMTPKNQADYYKTINKSKSQKGNVAVTPVEILATAMGLVHGALVWAGKRSKWIFYCTWR